MFCSQRSLCALVALSILLFCVGCGNEGWVPVSGKVTLDGKPLPKGTISFESADGNGPSGGGAIENGEYQAPRVMAGKKIVRISSFRVTGRKVPGLGSSAKGLYASAMVDEIEDFIPPIYNARTTLACEVGHSGQNRFDFDLKSR